MMNRRHRWTSVWIVYDGWMGGEDDCSSSFRMADLMTGMDGCVVIFLSSLTNNSLKVQSRSPELVATCLATLYSVIATSPAGVDVCTEIDKYSVTVSKPLASLSWQGKTDRQADRQMYICMYVCKIACMCMHVCMLHVCMYVRLCVCKYVCVRACVCMCVCM